MSSDCEYCQDEAQKTISRLRRRIERLEESLGRLIKAATTRDALREIAAALIEASTVLEEEG